MDVLEPREFASSELGVYHKQTRSLVPPNLEVVNFLLFAIFFASRYLLIEKFPTFAD